MPIVSTTASTLRGVEAVAVDIEVDIGGAYGQPVFIMVGLAEATVRESRVRVQSAIESSGLRFPGPGKICVNLAPAHVRKDGTGFDLPMALAILGAAGHIPPARMKDALMLGELSLHGDVRPVRGAIAAAEAALRSGKRLVLVAPENGPEAALVRGVEVRTVRTLGDAVAFLKDGNGARAPVVPHGITTSSRGNGLDLKDVKGQGFPRRALEVAAAGGHNLLFIGGPGAGKTMLARRLPSILPKLTWEEALEVTRVQSVAGLNIGGGLVDERPFRAPHHSTTPAGLVGGGASLPRPGEVTLAHRGVLFLDELPEFARPTLEVLREPLESGEVVLSRASGTLRYPARCLLVASMNPCPCGRYGDKSGRCRCNSHDVQRYQGRVSGPLLDRIDMHVIVPAVDLVALEDEAPGEASADVAARVLAARTLQMARFGGRINATATTAEIAEHARADAMGRRLMALAVAKYSLTARGYDRVLRVARTIADLDGAAEIDSEHVTEALNYRTQVAEEARAA